MSCVSGLGANTVVVVRADLAAVRTRHIADAVDSRMTA
jgi:2-phospho-L-lactate guanylyltransferase (CobY/MobA/RfbA family)